jgi:hypothetical protein
MMFRSPERVCRSSRKGFSFQLVTNLNIDLLCIFIQVELERLAHHHQQLGREGSRYAGGVAFNDAAHGHFKLHCRLHCYGLHQG